MKTDEVMHKAWKILVFYFLFLFAFEGCGWAGLNQSEQAKKNQQNVIVAAILGYFSHGSSSNVELTNVAPTVTSVLPSANSVNIPINSSIIISFSKAMLPATISSTSITLTEGITPVTSQVTMLGNQVVVVSPTSSLSASKSYTVTILTTVQSVDGLPLAADYTWNFTTGAAGVDLTPLSATISPTTGTTGVPISGAILISFNKTINASTISTSTVYLEQGTTTVAGTASAAGSSGAVFVPSSPLNYNTSYTLTVTTGVTDISGPPISLTANVTSTFTTDSSGSSALAISSILPSDNATNVQVNSNIIISFNRDMSASTINSTNITLTQGVTPITSTVSVLNSQVAVLSPSSSLSTLTLYTVTVSTSVQSVDGLSMATNYTMNFTTGAALPDLTPLTATISPANGSIEVSIHGGVLISFNKTITPSTINSSTIYLKQGVTTITGTTNVAGSSGAVFIPSSPLAYNTSYTLTVTTGVTDTSITPISLVANETSTFTTEVDTTPPVVSFISPSSGATNIATNSNIIISFSKAMAPATLNNTNITLLDGIIPIAGTVSVIETTGASFVPTSALGYSKTYNVNISTSVTDSNGIALASPYTTVFTTVAATPDTTPPTVSSSNPSNGSTGIPITQTILITFSKPIDSSTINGTNITLTQGVTPITGTVYAAGSNGAVFQPTSSLEYNKPYTLTLSTGIQDTATTPNALTAPVTVNFTTIADATPLSVASVSPSNTSINISPLTGILVTFNKAVNPATLIAANITLTATGSLYPMVLTITPVGTSAALILPNSPMANFTLHTLQLTAGVQDTLGNPLTGTPYNSIFTTSSESGADGGAVTTISGPLSATAGNAEGTALDPFAARYSSPKYLAWAIYGGSEKLFVTDQTNNKVRTVTISGASAGVTASIAGLSSPRGVVVNNANTELYITNTTGRTIKRVTLPSTLVVTAFAGSVTAGYVNATGIAAKFNNPEGIAIDSAGNFYVTDQTNHVIRKITSAGVVTTLAGAYPSVVAGTTDATGTSARFNTPRGLAVDPSGNVYVTDTNNHTIRKITSAGVVTTIAGSPLNLGYVNGSGVAARFYYPQGIVYVPVAAPNIGGKLLITDTYNHAIRILDPNTGMVTTYAGPLPSSTGGTGTALSGYVNSTRFASRFNYPIGITVNPTTGVVYITDTSNHAIKMITY